MALLPSLPETLQYLQPFLATLGQLPPEELDDADSSALVGVLRQRIEGLDAVDAERVLSDDRDLLEHWLTNSSVTNNPAYWVLGFLASPPHLLDELLHSSEEVDEGPIIEFEPPAGWTATHAPFQLTLEYGKTFACITAIDEFGLDIDRAQFAHWSAPPPLEMTLETEEVTFGEVRGTKYRILQMTPVTEKNLTYLLEVPGGYAHVDMGNSKDANFDESALEVQLHTLRFEASA